MNKELLTEEKLQAAFFYLDSIRQQLLSIEDLNNDEYHLSSNAMSVAIEAVLEVYENKYGKKIFEVFNS